MIKAIFFDFAGVLSTDEKGRVTMVRNLSEAFGVGQEKMRSAFEVHREDLRAGKIDLEDVWDALGSDVGASVSSEMIHEVYRKTPINQEMMDLAKQLRSNYKVGIITANYRGWMRVLKAVYDLDSVFHVMINASDIGSSKDQQPIFDAALEAVSMKPEECLFIDNAEDNLIIPRQMGFHCYFFETAKNDVTALKAWLQEQGVEI